MRHKGERMTEPGPSEPPRWRYRLTNLSRALALLQEALVLAQTRELSALENDGMIQRFEYTWDLSWKVLRDVLEDQGIPIEVVSPRAVLRTAFEAGLISRSEDWQRSIGLRNRLAHMENQALFDQACNEIRSVYTTLFEDLEQTLKAMVDAPEPRNVLGVPEFSRRELALALRTFGDRLERVALFGSRATGRASIRSDIDLAVWGPLSPDDLTRLEARLEESDLPVTVDLVHVGEATDPDLRGHIERVALDFDWRTP
jgi:nucleotidyltransferase substrate binding protein (TIGR01987 family)